MDAFKQIALEYWAQGKPYAIAFVAGLVLGLLL
jgi:hypothetical protein